MRNGCYWLGCAAIVGTSACSVLFDSDDFRGRPVIDAMSADANPDEFAIVSVFPDEVFEGQGAVLAGQDPGLVPAIPVAVQLANAIEGVVVTAVPQEPRFADIIDGDVLVSDDLTFAGFLVRVPVDETLGAGERIDIEVTAAQDGSEPATAVVQIVGLDEFDVPGQVPPNGLYSRIALSGDVDLSAATEPIRLRATSEIEVEASLDVSAPAVGLAPGPGGCAGGAAETAGQCGTGGGSSTVGLGEGTGGGGASNSTQGAPGGGGGVPGALEPGDALVSPLAISAGNGGGGGGDGGLFDGAAGGAGGGGGGALMLDSEGRLTLSADIAANGAAGLRGSGIELVTPKGGGGGGGGAGGVILLRAATEFVYSAGAISASGGAGGAAGDGIDPGSPGGAGGDGWIRLDAGGGDVQAVSIAAGTRVRGPVWSSSMPSLSRTRVVMAPIVGGAGTAIGVQLRDEALVQVELGPDGTAAFEATLEPGSNRLCVLVANDIQHAQRDEGVHCRNIVFIP